MHLPSKNSSTKNPHTWKLSFFGLTNCETFLHFMWKWNFGRKSSFFAWHVREKFQLWSYCFVTILLNIWHRHNKDKKPFKLLKDNSQVTLYPLAAWSLWTTTTHTSRHLCGSRQEWKFSNWGALTLSWKMLSFGFCPNCPIWTACTTFFRSRNSRFGSQFRSKYYM